MPIERHGRFQAKCVPCSQAARQHAKRLARFHHFLPYPGAGGFVGGNVDLEAILACVAGAGDEGVVQAADGAPCEPVVLDFGQVHLSQPGEGVFCAGSLDGELGVVVAVVADVHTRESADLGADPLVVLRARAGVGDQQVVVVAELMDQDVVDERSLGIEHGGVLRLAIRQLGGIVHGEGLDGGQRARPAELDVAHMADASKKADRGAVDSHVLRSDAGVLDRHIPATEVDHLRSELPMDAIQCGLT